VDARMKADRKRLRQAIIAQLSQRQMTILELAGELDHLAPLNQVKRELRELVGRDIVCSIETPQRKHDLFETWERAMERVRAKGSERRHIVSSRIRRGERVG